MFTIYNARNEGPYRTPMKPEEPSTRLHVNYPKIIMVLMLMGITGLVLWWYGVSWVNMIEATEEQKPSGVDFLGVTLSLTTCVVLLSGLTMWSLPALEKFGKWIAERWQQPVTWRE